jgi:hypothetical protein
LGGVESLAELPSEMTACRRRKELSWAWAMEKLKEAYSVKGQSTPIVKKLLADKIFSGYLN